jgi:hypothetical protein
MNLTITCSGPSPLLGLSFLRTVAELNNSGMVDTGMTPSTKRCGTVLALDLAVHCQRACSETSGEFAVRNHRNPCLLDAEINRDSKELLSAGMLFRVRASLDEQRDVETMICWHSSGRHHSIQLPFLLHQS